jgi:hypothetical protein
MFFHIAQRLVEKSAPRVDAGLNWARLSDPPVADIFYSNPAGGAPHGTKA